jgi:ankyrin repeat protein
MTVNFTDTHDNTPLNFSAEYGHLDATKILVERGAAINKTNNVGDTPVTRAAQKGKLEIVRYLTNRR